MMRRGVVLGLLGVMVVCALAGDAVEPKFAVDSEIAKALKQLSDEGMRLARQACPDLSGYDSETGEPPHVANQAAFRKGHRAFLQACQKHEAAARELLEKNPGLLTWPQPREAVTSRNLDELVPPSSYSHAIFSTSCCRSAAVA